MNTETVKSSDRPDAVVFAEARSALDRCPTVPSTVDVFVENGVVRLAGVVQHPGERTEAETAVRAAIGDALVVNEISVTQQVNKEGFEPPDERRA